jgi:hypothetical protein
MKRILTLLALATLATTNTTHSMKWVKKTSALIKACWQKTYKTRAFMRKPAVQIGTGLAIYAGLYATIGKKIGEGNKKMLQQLLPADCELLTLIKSTKDEIEARIKRVSEQEQSLKMLEQNIQMSERLFESIERKKCEQGDLLELLRYKNKQLKQSLQTVPSADLETAIQNQEALVNGVCDAAKDAARELAKSKDDYNAQLLQLQTSENELNNYQNKYTCLQSAQKTIREVEENSDVTGITWYVGPHLVPFTHAETKRIALRLNPQALNNPFPKGTAYHQLRYAKSLGCKLIDSEPVRGLTMPSLYVLSCLIPATRAFGILGRFFTTTTSCMLAKIGFLRHEAILADYNSLFSIEHDQKALEDMRNLFNQFETITNNLIVAPKSPLFPPPIRLLKKTPFNQLPLTMRETVGHLLLDPVHPRAKKRADMYQRALNKLNQKNLPQTPEVHVSTQQKIQSLIELHDMPLD